MKNREIATLSIKILSLYTFVHAVDKLPDVIYFLFETEKPFEGLCQVFCVTALFIKYQRIGLHTE
ncbi:MAG: hypothetical protein CSA22_06025 [Deltaproteobacteria bacterium]|nr:MAG: hypothetical protein CSA22_06025 [Deltaproteobacteria bacterium]